MKHRNISDVLYSIKSIFIMMGVGMTLGGIQLYEEHLAAGSFLSIAGIITILGIGLVWKKIRDDIW